MAVIRDVAKLAGVSPSTVSKFLNKPEDLTEEYKVKVEAAIKELNYRPSAFARSLRTQKTNTIALVVPEIANPFYTEVYNVIRTAAFERGYTTILYTTEENIDVLNEFITQFSKQNVDGLIFCFLDEDEIIQRFIEVQHSVPITLMSWDINTTEFNSVIINLFEGFYRSTQYLLNLGHRRIAYVGGPPLSRISKEKLSGYKKAMQDAHIETDEAYIVAGKYRFQTGYQATKKCMQLTNPPTAIVCANDVLAIGCIKYLKYNEFDIPDDVAVIGFDGIQLSYIYDPSISTNVIPIDDMGREAVNMLITKIEKPGSKNRQAIFDTSLVIRRSTKKDAPIILDL